MIDIPKAAGTIAILNREHSNKRVLGLCLLLVVLSYWFMAGVLHHHDDDSASAHDHLSCLMLHATQAAAVNTFNLHSAPLSEIIRSKTVSVVYEASTLQYCFIRAPPLNYA